MTPRGDELVIELEGELDMDTSPRLRQLLEDLLLRPQPPNVVLDLSRLDFFDSTGITAVVRAARLSGGALRLRNANAQAHTVLRVMNLAHLIEEPPDERSL
jgi:anti-anti-sigma factor